MAKGYWITVYHGISDPARQAQYAALAGPAIAAGGGRMLARGMASTTFEGGDNQRTVVIEFDSVNHAIAAYSSPAYQAAVAVLGAAADREIRIVEGV